MKNQYFKQNSHRHVRFIENSGLMSGAQYFSEFVPDDRTGRTDWFESLLKKARDVDLVFLDPDNGIEVKSTPCGRKNSSNGDF